MYVVVLAALQWLHILCGIFWFGSVLTADFIVLPTLRTLGPDIQETFLRAFVTRAPRIVTVIGGMTILLGLIRGIAGGVLSDLGSAYGLTWMAAFIVGSSLLFLGTRILTPAAHRLINLPQGPQFETAMGHVKRLTLTELAGFMVILALMIAMRFGY